MPRHLPVSFYQQDTIEVARRLLGHRLIHAPPGARAISGVIVETEAYLGLEDPACHTYGGRRTPRTQSMYLPGGSAYIYFIYGMHFCFNVVTRGPTEPEAVLIRALATADGERCANGPGKVCRYLNIDRRYDGKSLMSESLYIAREANVADEDIESAPRVGVEYAGDAAEWPLRFFIKGHPAVSRTWRPQPSDLDAI